MAFDRRVGMLYLNGKDNAKKSDYDNYAKKMLRKYLILCAYVRYKCAGYVFLSSDGLKKSVGESSSL